MEEDELLDCTEFKASDLLKLAGMTYRQLHDWENRAGVVESERAAPEGWRKFDLTETLSLCISADLRRQFSLPLSEVGNLYKWLLGKDTDEVNEVVRILAEQNLDLMRQNQKISKLINLQGKDLTEALKDKINRSILQQYCQQLINRMSTEPVKQAWILSSLGFVVYLYTDFKCSLILTETNMIQAIANRLPARSTIVCPLNPIFNLIRDRLKLSPFPLDSYGPSFLEKWIQLQKDADISKEEHRVLGLIRSKKYRRMVVHLDDGQIIRASAEEDIAMNDLQTVERSIQDAIRDHRYQTISLSVQDGKPIRLKRDISMHLTK